MILFAHVICFSPSAGAIDVNCGHLQTNCLVLGHMFNVLSSVVLFRRVSSRTPPVETWTL